MINVVLQQNADVPVYGTSDRVTQWDKGVQLAIKGLQLDEAPEIHFENNQEENAIIVASTYDAQEQAYVVNVPQTLLEEPYGIRAYIYETNGDESTTVGIIEIPVIKRKKPVEYDLSVSSLTVTGDVTIPSAENLKDPDGNPIISGGGGGDLYALCVELYDSSNSNHGYFTFYSSKEYQAQTESGDDQHTKFVEFITDFIANANSNKFTKNAAYYFRLAGEATNGSESTREAVFIRAKATYPGAAITGLTCSFNNSTYNVSADSCAGWFIRGCLKL